MTAANGVFRNAFDQTTNRLNVTVVTGSSTSTTVTRDAQGVLRGAYNDTTGTIRVIYV